MLTETFHTYDEADLDNWIVTQAMNGFELKGLVFNSNSGRYFAVMQKEL